MSFKDSAVKVLMMGAARVGKTSLLAALSEDATLEEATRGTNLTMIPEYSEPIQEAGRRMNDLFDFTTPHDDEEQTPKNVFKRFKINKGGTEGYRDFSIKLSIKGANKASRYAIGFKDIAGEYIDRHAEGTLDVEMTNDLISWVKESDVLLITIDSILLMEEGGSNDAANRVEDICNLVTEMCEKNELDNDARKKNKLILFVPTKCEKYFHIHLEEIADPAIRNMRRVDIMEQMNNRIKEKYAKIFDYCAEGDRKELYQLVITPIVTLGNIEFACYEKDTAGQRSADSMWFRYCVDDVYKANGSDKPVRAPQFCDQPLLYILYYELLNIQNFIKNLTWWELLRKAIADAFFKLVTDKDLIPEMELLKNNIKKNVEKDGWYVSEIVQDPIGMIKPEE